MPRRRHICDALQQQSARTFGGDEADRRFDAHEGLQACWHSATTRRVGANREGHSACSFRATLARKMGSVVESAPTQGWQDVHVHGHTTEPDVSS